MGILIPCSIGELYDKITILRIKEKNIKKDPIKLINVQNELSELEKIWNNLPPLPNEKSIEKIEKLCLDLSNINQQIWNIEDSIRIEEKNKDWGEDFIQLARNVYFKNDKRAEIKREINILFNSGIVEEKSYEKYN